ncbi:MAG: hypothetical protein RIQ60_1845 [Pseudomonadota bacterium]|jgi:hypothetical protein
MTMPRPLMHLRIGDLEEMFASAAGKPDVLRQLEHELQFRQVPRALTLLDKVQRSKAAAVAGRPVEPLAPATPVATPEKPAEAPVQNAAPPAVQLSLISTPALSVQPERRPLISALTSTSTPAQPPRPGVPAPARPVPPAMSLADACRLLNVAPGASWETIERARREAVQKSSPLGTGTSDAHRGPALAAARLANSAYAALAAMRCTSILD